MFNKQIHKRIKILLLLIILAFIIIISKIFYIQVIEYKKLSNLANNLWSRNLIIGANRGRILTNDNVTIASNLTTVSLVVVPNQIKNKDDITDAQKLRSILCEDKKGLKWIYSYSYKDNGSWIRICSYDRYIISSTKPDNLSAGGLWLITQETFGNNTVLSTGG